MEKETSRSSVSRRTILAATTGIAGAADLAGRYRHRTTPSCPHRRASSPVRHADWARGHPSIYPDPDVIVVDPSFNQVRRAIAPIQRVWTGALSAEGPAWSGQGQYLVFSDVSGNTQYRYIWDEAG